SASNQHSACMAFSIEPYGNGTYICIVPTFRIHGAHRTYTSEFIDYKNKAHSTYHVHPSSRCPVLLPLAPRTSPQSVFASIKAIFNFLLFHYNRLLSIKSSFSHFFGLPILTAWQKIACNNQLHFQHRRIFISAMLYDLLDFNQLL
ncbi:MAG: hypothetical protein LUI13_00955, partial [Lachnospiraceae bacterium]|nr:hypothetical protein [Lachnospiraceae bacterium]